MQLTRHIAAISGALLIGGAVTVVSYATAQTTAPSATPSTQPVNRFCAVEHEDNVDPAVTTVYKGETIGFCCKDCLPKFEKDPEKYMKDLKR